MVSPLPAYNSMVASATVLPAQRRLTPQYASWQEQAWGFYDQLGEFESAVSWRANTMSRVRLLAAKLAPGGDEPEPVNSGPAAEAVGRLAGGTGGQSQLMAELTAHLTVVGEAWVVGEDDPDNDIELWSVRSADELRVQSGPAGSWQLRDDPRATAWRTPSNVMVVRVWDPHPRRGWEADPAARHAFSAMTKLDLANKRIIATLISRLASNGILLYDKERLSFPTTAQTPAAGPVGAPDALGGGEPDPFAVVLVDIASRGIKDPTSPEAVIPIPIGYSLGANTSPADVDPKLLLQHIMFASDVDEKLLAQRQDALRELATALDMPVEALLGVGDLNHWSAWAVEESGIKIHVAPPAELICHALTVGYLKPYLEAAGEDPAGLIVWYDPSELTLRPDRSANTVQAYDRLEASGDALRREVGLSEDDKPDEAELKSMILKKQAGMESLSATALAELTGTVEAVPAAPGAETVAEEPGSGGQQGPPDTLDQPPPDGGQQAPPDRAALAAMDPAVLAALADDVAAVIASLSPGSRWVDPLTPVRHANSH